MHKPSVSVITVALNAAGDLPLTIESVLAQTWPELEYLIVDGGSWDASWEVLRRYAGRVDRIVTMEDAGVYHAMNRAAHLAKGEYLLFLNAGDCLYAPDAIEAMFARIDEDVDVLYGDHIYAAGRVEHFRPSSDFGTLREALRSGLIDADWHLRMPCHQATFVRAAALRAMPYDTRYRICADHDWLWRAYDAGLRLRYIDEIVARYTAGGLSDSGASRIKREWAHSYRRFSDKPARVDRFFFGSVSLSPWFTGEVDRYDGELYDRPPLLCGGAVGVGDSDPLALARLLADGWSAPECEIGIVWSIAPEALLAANLDVMPSRIAIRCHGNPHVAGGQNLTVLVNGEVRVCFRISSGHAPVECWVDVGGVWWSGVNVIGLSVDHMARPPADGRTLGIAFSGMMWV